MCLGIIAPELQLGFTARWLRWINLLFVPRRGVWVGGNGLVLIFLQYVPESLVEGCNAHKLKNNSSAQVPLLSVLVAGRILLLVGLVIGGKRKLARCWKTFRKHICLLSLRAFFLRDFLRGLLGRLLLWGLLGLLLRGLLWGLCLCSLSLSEASFTPQLLFNFGFLFRESFCFGVFISYWVLPWRQKKNPRIRRRRRRRTKDPRTRRRRLTKRKKAKQRKRKQKRRQRTKGRRRQRKMMGRLANSIRCGS